jgi:L-ascorbate metabolism protein UlaG (beta-lactamase superfamily)
MNITYYGHSCFKVEIGGINLLFDPFITGNPLASSIDINTIEADYILISHGHGDHAGDAEAIAKRTGALLISNYEITEWFKTKGVENVAGMNIGGKSHFDFGTLKMVSAIHSSSMPDGSYGGNPAGFVVESAEKTFYYAGDTALTSDMKLLAERFKIDFAFLPIGDYFTMGIEDAIVAANFVNTKKIIAMHFDSFPPIEIDHLASNIIAKNAGKDLIIPEIGATFSL